MIISCWSVGARPHEHLWTLPGSRPISWALLYHCSRWLFQLHGCWMPYYQRSSIHILHCSSKQLGRSNWQEATYCSPWQSTRTSLWDLGQHFKKQGMTVQKLLNMLTSKMGKPNVLCAQLRITLVLLLQVWSSLPPTGPMQYTLQHICIADCHPLHYLRGWLCLKSCISWDWGMLTFVSGGLRPSSSTLLRYD